MPEYSVKLPIEPELVWEVTATGRPLRRWRTPVDSVPVGVQGDRLLVRNPVVKLWITVDGDLAWFRKGDRMSSEPERIQCPKTKVFGESAYTECGLFRDIASGKRRILIYQAICT